MRRTEARAKAERFEKVRVLASFVGALVGVMAAVATVGFYVFVRFDAWGEYTINPF